MLWPVKHRVFGGIKSAILFLAMLMSTITVLEEDCDFLRSTAEMLSLTPQKQGRVLRAGC